ncbi:hypothetical protein MRX96_040701 [Rhipicephalus microplus]
MPTISTAEDDERQRRQEPSGRPGVNTPSCVASLSSGLVQSSYFQYLLENEGLLLSWTPAGHHGTIPDNAVRADPDASGDVIVFARQLKYEDEGYTTRQRFFFYALHSFMRFVNVA